MLSETRDAFTARTANQGGLASSQSSNDPDAGSVQADERDRRDPEVDAPLDFTVYNMNHGPYPEAQSAGNTSIPEPSAGAGAGDCDCSAGCGDCVRGCCDGCGACCGVLFACCD
jgi:hypothetical protein